MPTKVVRVVDASAFAAILFGEPEAEEVVARLQGSRLVAPALLPYEIASVCLKKIRRHPDMRDRLLESYAGRKKADIEEIEVAFSEVITLAESNDITCYDASYLWLAMQLKAELVTLDENLATVASHCLPKRPPPD